MKLPASCPEVLGGMAEPAICLLISAFAAVETSVLKPLEHRNV